MMGNLMERFKKGGRLQNYMVILMAYYAFTSFTGRGNNRRSSEADQSATHESVEYDDDVETPAAERGPSYRQFVEADGMWLSYLQRPGKPDTTLLLLHRPSSSAETE